MSNDSLTRPPVHVTAKIGDRGPELMVNIYADDAADLTERLDTINDVLEAQLGVSLRQLASCALVNLAGAVDRTYREATSRREKAPEPAKEPANEPTPIHQGGDKRCHSETCSYSGEPMIPSTSQYAAAGDLFCPGEDPAEEAGYCRWVHDRRGTRRKPTRAESNSERRAAGTRR